MINERRKTPDMRGYIAGIAVGLLLTVLAVVAHLPVVVIVIAAVATLLRAARAFSALRAR